MGSKMKSTSLWVSLSLINTAIAAAVIPRPEPLQETSYDYVIVGGGVSGLVVANRLSENKKVSVLVIENGPIDDRPAVTVPFLAANNLANYYNMPSAPEPFMQNTTWGVYVGNVVGGGSIVNGMQFDRGSNADYDAWEQLGNPGWGYRGLQDYFKKFTNFQAPPEAIRKRFNITYDANAYGKSGPLNVSSPSYMFEDYADIVGSYVARDDIPHSKEGFAKPIGIFWTPNSIDNTTKERCHARKAYYDPVISRANLHLLPNTHVDKITFKKGKKLVANGVQITSNDDHSTTFIYAKKEVIMAAGSVFTPHILMLSGIGPKDVLSAANVEIKKDLAAVGSNFQDHPAMYMSFELSNQSIPNQDMLLSPTPNLEFDAISAEEYFTNRTGPYTIARGNALLFLPLKYFSEKYKEITAMFAQQNPTDYLPERYAKNKALLKGFLKQREILHKRYLSDDSAAGECTMSPSGQTATAMQKPLSRGAITLNTTHPTANPVVVRNAFQNPIDMTVFGELIRWNRAHWTRSPVLKRFSPVELVPGAQYETDDEIMDAGIKSAALNPSFAHASGACPMMPEKLGGCVDTKLRVYGVKNLRVVDASIMPLIPAAHLQATVYAVAEKAADIIKRK